MHWGTSSSVQSPYIHLRGCSEARIMNTDEHLQPDAHTSPIQDPLTLGYLQDSYTCSEIVMGLGLVTSQGDDSTAPHISRLSSLECKTCLRSSWEDLRCSPESTNITREVWATHQFTMVPVGRVTEYKSVGIHKCPGSEDKTQRMPNANAPNNIHKR